MEDNNSRWILLALIGAALAAGAWLFRDLWAPAATTPPEPVPEASPAEPRQALEPLYPVEPIAPRDQGGELIPLPPLEESDEYFALALVDLFGEDFEDLLASELLIERVVGTTDNLGRGRVPEKIRPIGRLPGSFLVDGPDDDDGYVLSPRNYARYEELVTTLENASVEDTLDAYRRFYPLLNEAYRMLGYPDGHFNDRLVEIIDLLLATPEPGQPIELVREHVLYEYRDPKLEALSSGQKMLLRMGPANAARVKTVLRTFREALAQPAG